MSCLNFIPINYRPVQVTQDEDRRLIASARVRHLLPSGPGPLRVTSQQPLGIDGTS
jgi:hypothetical protein